MRRLNGFTSMNFSAQSRLKTKFNDLTKHDVGRIHFEGGICGRMFGESIPS